MATAPTPTPPPAKTIVVNGQNVQVTLTPLPNEPMLSWEITAVCGGTTQTQRHTIGAASGEIGSYTQASLQAEIDAVRLAVATAAANIEAARQLAANVT